MNGSLCTSCGVTIENTVVTGIFCQACHDKAVAPPPGAWKGLLKGPLGVGAAAVAVPSALWINLNGFNIVGAVCGPVGLVAGGLAVAQAIKQRTDANASKRLGLGALVALLGLYQLWASNILTLLQ